MKIAVQVPIKGKSSSRVPNKNFRNLNGKPLCCWILDEIVRVPMVKDSVYIDSEDHLVFQRINTMRGKNSFHFFSRDSWFAGDEANGNHLLSHFAHKNPDFDIYVQIFVTAVTLTAEIITEALDLFICSLDKYDSIFLVHRETGWIWYDGSPINYNHNLPDGLPRSQDATYLKETTGMYGITREALLRRSCRIGACPLLYEVESMYAIDIDTHDDLINASEALARRELGIAKDATKH